VGHAPCEGGSDGLLVTGRSASIGDGVSDVTRLLDALERGEPKAANDLIPFVCSELRLLAAQHLAREKPGQTLQATALVHEAYLRLVTTGDDKWQGRRHFFAAAAEAMRRILVENARRKRSLKRGGDRERVDVDAVEIPSSTPPEEVLLVDEALESLVQRDPAAAELVKLRFFVGMTQEEAATSLGISTSTADRMWALARVWMQRALEGENRPP